VERSTWRRVLGRGGIGVLVPLAGILTVPAVAGASAHDAGSASCYSSDHCWGVDSADPVTSSLVASVEDDLGTPDFWGRYLTAAGSDASPLSSSELGVLSDNGMGVLLIAADLGPDDVDTTGSAAVSDADGVADQAASAAESLGIPDDGTVAVFADIEASWNPSSDWISAYADEITADGYVAGFYGSPLNSFDSAFCTASDDDTNVYSAIVWSQNHSVNGTSAESSSPDFAPVPTSCAGGSTEFWQYALSSGSTPNVDEDETQSADEQYLYYP
jgi:hypothetical protein